ncbi:MAG: hypothetical protein RLZ56_61 [Bacteroidota bacterium]|jgi:uncharacterized protein (TIGR02145 family)
MKQILFFLLMIVMMVSSATAQVMPQGFLIGPDGGIQIGNQIWDSVNLNVTRYSNNDTITIIRTSAQWTDSVNAGSTAPMMLSYNFNTANDAVYGKLYNWYAVNDSRGLCPVGWHVPSNDDFTALSTFIGNNGGALKEVGIQGGNPSGHWLTPNTGALDTYGFTALPAGYQGTYTPSNQGKLAFFWTSTSYNTNQAYAWSLTKDAATFTSGFGNGKIAGYSVRCMRNP